MITSSVHAIAKSLRNRCLVGTTVLGFVLTTSILHGEEQDSIGQSERDGILQVMTAVGLDVETCAALNLTNEQAEAVFGAARTWYTSNAASWQSANATLAESRQEWVDAESGSSAASEAAAEVRTAEASLESVLSSLRTAIANSLTSGQQSLWQVMEPRTGKPMPEKILALSSEQLAQLAEARQKLASDLAATTSDADRATARTSFNESVTATLTDAEETVVNNFETYYAASLTNVVTAMNEVLNTAQQ